MPLNPSPHPGEVKNPNQSETLDLVREVQDNLESAESAEKLDRDDSLLDENFMIGNQWDSLSKSQRTQPGQERPILTMNMFPKFIYGLSGEQRQNKVSIKARPVDTAADPEVARVIDGLLRQIEYQSKSQIARSTAFQQALIGGLGYYEIDTKYVDDSSFDQEIIVRRIENHYSVYRDTFTKEFDFSDMNWCIATEWIERDRFKVRFPDAHVADLPGSHHDARFLNWSKEDKVRIGTYWKREFEDAMLFEYRLNDGRITTANSTEKDRIERIEALGGSKTGQEREVSIPSIKRYFVSLHEIHETVEWPGSFIPVIPVIGQEIFVGGQKRLVGVVRFGRDPQRAYNYSWSSAMETMGSQPKSPWLVTEAMVEGHESTWREANKKVFGYLPYSTDPERPGDKPQRIDPPKTSTAAVNMLQIAGEGMRATTTLFQANTGEQGNETSGRAILARQREGDNNTFVYVDNLNRAIDYEGRILIDLIPKIFVGSRILRILGTDGVPDLAIIGRNINDALAQGIDVPKSQLTQSPRLAPDGQPARDLQGQPLTETVAKTNIYDFGLGKYDVISTVGPSFATRRVELVNAYTEIMRVFPSITPFIIDIVIKNLDTAGADEILERIKLFQKITLGQMTAGPTNGQSVAGPGQAPSPAGKSPEQLSAQPAPGVPS